MTSSTQLSQNTLLLITAATWQGENHQLFDYESNKNVVQTSFDCDIASKYIYMFRNNSNSQVVFQESLYFKQTVLNTNQLLGCLKIYGPNHQQKIRFFNSKDISSIRENALDKATCSSEATGQKQEISLVVGSLRNSYNQIKGYKLKKGQTIRLGKIQFMIASNTTQSSKNVNSKFGSRQQKKNSSKVNDLSKRQCKYCYQGENQEDGGFLCSPCSCSGSCGLVHFTCLSKWSQSRVRKEFVGGFVQYNIQKFNCEVCKDEYPRYIEKDNKQYELLPIQIPEGDHLILQGITENVRSLIVIEDVPAQGFKIGRGQQCDIRIKDNSVSRYHANIQKVGKDYYIFDNKSKYGTLIREEKLEIQLSQQKQDIQIGNTVLSFKKITEK